MKIILVIFIFLSFTQIHAKKTKPIFDSKKIFNVSYMDSMEKCKKILDSLQIKYEDSKSRIPSLNENVFYPSIFIKENLFKGFTTNYNLVFKEDKLEFIVLRFFDIEKKFNENFQKRLKKTIKKMGGKFSYNNFERDLVYFDNAFIDYRCYDDFAELYILLTEPGNMD